MVIPAGYGQFNLRFTGTPLPTGAEVTIGFQRADPAKTLEESANDLMANLNTSNMEDLWTPQITLSEVLVKFGPDATGPSAVFDYALVGTTTGPPDSPNTSALIKKGTSDGGRAGRGRWYWPGISQQVLTDAGGVTPVFVTQINGHLDDFAAAMILSDMPLVVLHGEGSPLSTPSLITSLVMDTKVATQRRRLRR